MIAKKLIDQRIDLKETHEIIFRRRESWWYRTTGEELLVSNYQTLEIFIKFYMELKNLFQFAEERSIHARSITTDTGWKITLDRGLDIFQRYDHSLFSIED